MERKEHRQELKRKRKNFLPTLILTIILWLALAFIIYFFNPQVFLVVPLFILLFCFALFFTFSIILENTRRGLIIALSLTLFVIFRYLGVGNILNFILLTAIATVAELYFSRK